MILKASKPVTLWEAASIYFTHLCHRAKRRISDV